MAHVVLVKQQLSVFFTTLVKSQNGEALIANGLDGARARNVSATVTSAATTAQWNNHRVSIIDTPGHVDFWSVQRLLLLVYWTVRLRFLTHNRRASN